MLCFSFKAQLGSDHEANRIRLIGRCFQALASLLLLFEHHDAPMLGRFLMGLVWMGSEHFPLFLRFSLLLLKDKGKRQQFTAKMVNFTPAPSAPTPCKTSRHARVIAQSHAVAGFEPIQEQPLPALPLRDTHQTAGWRAVKHDPRSAAGVISKAFQEAQHSEGPVLSNARMPLGCPERTLFPEGPRIEKFNFVRNIETIKLSIRNETFNRE